MNKRWVMTKKQPESAASLANELGVSRIVAQLLCNRGLADPAVAHKFLHPTIDDLHDPDLMAGMGQAVERIGQAIARREKIRIHGDYDVDGTTSIVILRKTLELLGADVSYHVPKRLVDGYGLKSEAIEQSHADGVRLVISADCGIRSHEVVKRAAELGVDVIITDHHLPEATLPPAAAVLNPRRPDCRYPEKNLAGVGVALKLVQALLRRAGRERALESLLKIAAIGTVADMVPLTGENRIIAKYGLNGLRSPKNHGLKALLDVSGVRTDRPIGYYDIAFRVAPRINAMGRMGEANPVVELFWSQDAGHATQIAQQLDDRNRARQQAEEAMLREVTARLDAQPDLALSHAIVLSGERWHRGVAGIVASKVVEKFYRPTVLISVENGIGHGSGRSIRPFHLLDGLDHCADLFERYGGHSHAAGLVIRQERIPELSQRLNQYAASRLTPDDLIPVVEVEDVVTVPEVDFRFLQEMVQLEPFGNGNPKPVFAIHEARIAGDPRVLKERHLKFRVMQNSRDAEVIWWNGASLAEDLRGGDRVSLAFTVDENEYGGLISVQLVLKDLKVSQ
jgi:single-stranded-DNA-specific exonuclease